MMLLYIIQVIAFVAGLILIVPVRFIKSKYFEKRITILTWLGTLGKRNKKRLDDMLQLREQTKLLHEEASARMEEVEKRLGIV